MTGQMGDEQLDREIRTFLAWQAEELAGAPTATEMALRLGSHTGSRITGLRSAPRFAWVLVLALLIVTVVATAVIGALVPRVTEPPLSTAYEAVFIRHEGIEGGRGDSVVFSIDARGQRREITRLSPVPFGLSIPTLGAVSPSGLLLVPIQDPTGVDLHYEVIDLKDPNAAPVVVAGISQDSEQLQSRPYYDVDTRPSVFWGPNDQVAIPWYERTPGGNDFQVAFVDGRTGVGSSVDLPEDVTLLPHWAADGSGALLTRRWNGGSLAVDGNRVSVLRRDGTFGDVATGIAPSIYSRHYRADGTVLDSSADVVQQAAPDGSPELVLTGDGDEIRDAAWTATGDGIWLVHRSGIDGGVLTVERRVPSSASTTVATVDGAPDASGGRPDGRIVGLAPDDSMLVLGLDRVMGTPENGSNEGVNTVRLIAPESHRSFEIEGTFAGWLEVEP